MVKQELIKFGRKIAGAGLVAGAGGNISAREGNIVWMKPSGFGMDAMGPDDLCGMDLATEKQVIGKNNPTSEVNKRYGVLAMIAGTFSVPERRPRSTSGALS